MLASTIAQILRAATAAHGKASLVVSGGTTPGPLFRVLRSIRLPWERVTVVPSDERWVAPDDAASNEAMIRRELLAEHATSAKLLSLYRPNEDADEALPALSAALAQVKRPFDAVVLGMGEDGHTASLFPDSPDIDRALGSSDCVLVQRLARLPQARVTLTARALLDAHEIHLLFFGQQKRAVFERAARRGAASELPVRAILHQSAVPVTAYWAP
jgi:6-phosphogluconolactonase